MIALTDIKRGYLKKLRESFPEYKIYGSEVIEGYTRPSFFVRILQTAGRRENRSTRYTSCILETTVFAKERDEAKTLNIIAEIEQLTKDYLDIEGHYLPVTDFDFKYAGREGNIPVIDIKIEFLQDVREPEIEPLMNQFKINTTKGH